MTRKDSLIKKLKEEIRKAKEQIRKLIEEKEHIEKEFEAFKLKHVGTVDELKKAMHIKPDKNIKSQARSTAGA